MSFGGDAANCCLPNFIAYTAAIIDCEKGQQWQQTLGLLSMMQHTAVLPVVISTQQPSVLV